MVRRQHCHQFVKVAPSRLLLPGDHHAVSICIAASICTSLFHLRPLQHSGTGVTGRDLRHMTCHCVMKSLTEPVSVPKRRSGLPFSGKQLQMPQAATDPSRKTFSHEWARVALLFLLSPRPTSVVFVLFDPSKHGCYSSR